jgi:hypothetical protein
VDAVVSIALIATIVGFMLAWYFGLLTNNLLFVAIVPVGLLHWYKRKLEKLLKVYGGAQVALENKRLVLLKPYQNYEAAIRFNEIISVQSGHWLFLDKMKLSLKGNRQIELINFNDQDLILSRLNVL